jgi:hypothetical protein
MQAKIKVKRLSFITAPLVMIEFNQKCRGLPLLKDLNRKPPIINESDGGKLIGRALRSS